MIARCLAPVRPLITRWLFVDTGSTNGTKSAVHIALADLSGEGRATVGRDFAHNRSDAPAFT